MIQRFPHNWRVKSEFAKIIVRDNLIDQGQGYWIEVEQTLTGLRATIRFEDFALKLFQRVEAKINRSTHLFSGLFRQSKNLSLSIYRQSVQNVFETSEPLPDGCWLILELRREENDITSNIFLDVLISLVIFLIPYYTEGELEGEATTNLMTKVERNLLNRSLCLAFHGYNCKACGLNFQKMYGEVASRFIHVHHLHPITERGVCNPDPINEMVPLCPNCHAVAHMKLPPFTISEIITMLEQNN